MDYYGSDFDSGLVNCSLVYKIPDNAVLNYGDTVGFSVVDETGKTLADDSTENASYANVTIEYKLENGENVPNTMPTLIPVPVGTKANYEPLYEINGYTLVRAENLGNTVGSNGLTVTYYYGEPVEEALFEITYENGSPADKTIKVGYYKARLSVPKGKTSATVIIAKYVDGLLVALESARADASKELIETKSVRVTVSDMRKQPEIKAYAFEDMENIKPMYEFRHITK